MTGAMRTFKIAELENLIRSLSHDLGLPIKRQPFKYFTELQCYSAAAVATPGEAGRLCFIFSNLAGCGFVRIVEKELIAVEIIDYQKPVAPPTLLDRNALGLEFFAQRVQRGDRGLARLRLDVQRNEHQPLANFLRPRVGQDKRAALPVDLGDIRSAILVVAPGVREAEPVNVKTK